MDSALLEPETREWTATELRSIPALQRDAILAEAAERAYDDYRLNSDLTDFEAFREGDLHGRSFNTETR